MSCPVCYLDLPLHNNYNCGHLLCDNCFNQWRPRNNTCPECRALVRYELINNILIFNNNNVIINNFLNNQNNRIINNHNNRIINNLNNEIINYLNNLHNTNITTD